MGINYNPGIVTDGLVLYADAANPTCYSPNVHPKPTDIYAWVNTPSGANSTLSRDTTVQSPVGVTPMKMVQTANDPYTPTYGNSSWHIAPAASGQTWTVSVWAKADRTTSGQIFVFGANSSGLNVETLAVGINITTVWQRFSHTVTFSSASTVYIQVRLDGNDIRDGSGINTQYWWDGLQVERASSVSPFNPKTNTNGTNFLDLSNNKYAMTDLGGTTVVKSGGNSYFNVVGYAAGISVPNQSFKGLYDLTMECVFKSTNTHTNYTGSFMSSGDWNNVHWAFGVAQGNNQIQLRRPFLSWNYTVNLNTWYHVVWRRSGTTNTVYVNNVSQGDQTDSTDIALVSNATNTAIGRETYAGGYFGLEGHIGVAKIYNRALSNLELSQNFNAIRGRFGL